MQKIITGFLFLLFFAAQATAQDSVDLKIMELIREQGLKHSKIELFAHHLTDGSGPRLTNSPGYNGPCNGLSASAKSSTFPIHVKKHGASLEKDGAMNTVH